MRVLGLTSHFDAEAFYGAVIAATFKTAEPGNMKTFLAEYLDQCDPERNARRRSARRKEFDSLWEHQVDKIAAAMSADAAEAHDAGPGGLFEIAPQDVQLDTKRLHKGVDLAALATSMLKRPSTMSAIALAIGISTPFAMAISSSTGAVNRPSASLPPMLARCGGSPLPRATPKE